MGWCSGTSIFDPMVDLILKLDFSMSTKLDLIVELISTLENEDWDCQSDSFYYEVPVVQEAFRIVHPDWKELDYD